VSNPASPQLVGAMSYPRAARAVASRAPLVLVGGGAGVLVFDVSDPTTPRELGVYSVPVGIPSQANIAIAGNLAFLSGHRAALRVLDLSAPINPREIGSYDPVNLSSAIGVAVAGSTIYVLDVFRGVRVFEMAA